MERNPAIDMASCTYFVGMSRDAQIGSKDGKSGFHGGNLFGEKSTMVEMALSVVACVV